MYSHNLLQHAVHKETGIDEFDVLIAGSGPIGATYARFLVDRGLSVVMLEIGDQDTRNPAAHKKNEIMFQKDIDKFVRVIQGALSNVSVPTSTTVIDTLGPSAWRPQDPDQMVVLNGRNPHQQEHNNLAAEAVTRSVGGMSTHWTCATPEFLKGLERPVIFSEDEKLDDEEWALLYDAARKLIGTSEHEFDYSIRHNTVLETLKKAYPDRIVKALPLACHRLMPFSPYVQWHSAENVFGDMFTNPHKKNQQGVQRGAFRLLTNTRCTRLFTGTQSEDAGVEIQCAEVEDLLASRFFGAEDPPQVNFAIRSKTFVVAAGAVATPQILANSGFGALRKQEGKDTLIPNLGKRITEQPMTFCQVILDQDVVDWARDLTDKPEWWKKRVEHHRQKHPKDPLPIPFHDPEPQVTIPATFERPWHTQIHRDAFSYGEAGPKVESRTVVDLRFFGMQDGVEKNRILFEDEVLDAYGMPQPTFEYVPSPKFADQTARMMRDMTDVAGRIGAYLPGSEPQFMTPGLALHLGGSVRLGRDQKDSVADFNSKVWKFKNLFVGGNGTIPTGFGANPTLTSICLAIRGAHQLYADLAGKGGKSEINATPKEWVGWLLDAKDCNFQLHASMREPHRSVALML